MTSILKRSKRNEKENQSKAKVEAKMDSVDLAWKAECLLIPAKALKPGVTDKIAKAHSTTMSACALLFSSDAMKIVNESETFSKVMDKLQSILLWLLFNDSSTGNRTLSPIFFL